MDKDLHCLPETAGHSLAGFDIEKAHHHGGITRRTSSLVQPRHDGSSSWLTCGTTMVTVMVGAGVLSLPSAMSWLGWVVGAIALVSCYAICLWCGLMLAAVYRVGGRRHPTYRDAVFFILGRRSSMIILVLQRVILIMAAVGYEIAAGESMAFIAKHGCGGRLGCVHSAWQMTLVFAGLQLVLSMLPDLESVWWVSVVGAVMSVGYSLLTVGLGASQASNRLGSLWGRAAPPGERAIGIFNALGGMACAFNCAIVQLEVQDTLKEPPDARMSMRKSVWMAITTAFVLYALVSVFGYMALGDSVSGMVLTSFAHAPAWSTLLGNAMVLVHMVSAFQVFCQPIFAALEAGLVRLLPCVDTWAARGQARVHAVRFVCRGLFVALLTVVAALFPFFDAFIGLIGSLAFWPTAVCFPMAMYLRAYQPGRATRVCMLLVFVPTAVLSAVAGVGSIATIVQSASKFSLGISSSAAA